MGDTAGPLRPCPVLCYVQILRCSVQLCCALNVSANDDDDDKPRNPT